MPELNWIAIWPIISLVIGFIFYYYKLEEKKVQKWEDDYFTQLLVPFYRQNRNRSIFDVKDSDIKDFMAPEMISDKEYVPSYIFQLIKQQRYDDVHKVLIVDYINNYPSLKQIISSTGKRLKNVAILFIQFFLIFAFACSLVLSIFIMIYSLSSIINGIRLGDIASVLRMLSVLIFLVLLMALLLFALKKNDKKDYTDCYSLDEEVVESLIESRLKAYGKISKSLIIFGQPQQDEDDNEAPD